MKDILTDWLAPNWNWSVQQEGLILSKNQSVPVSSTKDLSEARFLLNFVEGSRCISHRFLTFCLDFDERPVCPRLSVSITANLVLRQNQSPQVSTTIFTYKYKYIPTQILFSVDTNMENKKKPKYPRSMGILVTQRPLSYLTIS